MFKQKTFFRWSFYFLIFKITFTKKFFYDIIIIVNKKQGRDYNLSLNKNQGAEVENNIDDLNRYYTFLKQHEKNDKKILTKDEEYEYFKRIKAGDEEAKHEFFEHNIRLVLNVAKKYSSTEKKKLLSLDELVQEGNIGLCTAIEKFDEEKGVKFSTFAVDWITQAMDNAIDEKSRIISVPKNKLSIMKKYVQLEYAFKKEHGRMPTFDEISAKMQFTPATIRECLDVKSEMISINTESTSKNTIQKRNNADNIRDYKADMKQYFLLDDVKKILKDDEQKVIIDLFGLDDNVGHKTFEEVVKEMDKTPSEVEYIEFKALLKLKKYLIENFLEGDEV